MDCADDFMFQLTSEEKAEVVAICDHLTMDRGGIVVSNTVEITIDAEAILEDE